MKLIVGLGNPGLRYARTRHNAGFDTVDIIAAREGWPWDARKARSLLASGFIGDQKVTLAKPQTYMNDSGLAVGELVRFYKLDLADLLVISDDLDLPTGKIRLRPGGSAGGQHGLESIIHHLSSSAFARIKIGIGRPTSGRMENIDFLLSAPHGDERLTLQAACESAADCALCWVTAGVQEAMNTFNA
ncbi:MAG TPA: aminoacyl-tRNA hydrolase [Ktedonobacterales bacterium]|nr:aminoacyl-tRNA hydrolase [Ktedonobacterales bacterium]